MVELNIKQINVSKLILCLLIFTVLTIAWLYTYSLIGLKFEDVFDFSAMFRIIETNLILAALATGFLISCSLITILYFSRYLKQDYLVVIAGIGIMIASVVCLTFYKNPLIYLFMVMFYLVGILLFSFEKFKAKDVISKMKFGWGAPKRVMYILAVGGFLAGIVFTYADIDIYQDQIKSSIINVTSTMGIEELITKDELYQMTIGNKTEEDVRTMIMEANGLDPDSYDTLNVTVKTQIDVAVHDYYENLNESVEQTYNDMITRLEGSSEITERILERMPFISLFLELLPVFSGFLITSLVLFFFGILVSPFCAILAALLPEQEKQEFEELGEEKGGKGNFDKLSGMPFHAQRKMEIEKQQKKK